MPKELLAYCRLCSTSINLISMFSGKSRKTRDSLRKMIQETLQIQIEQCDSAATVCFNCLVDVSNFYFFKINCLQNQEKLKETRNVVPTVKKLKLEAIPVKDIQCPDIGSTREIMAWLKSKWVDLTQLQDQSKVSVDKDSQTFLKTFDASVQCEVVTIANGSQTDAFKTIDTQKIESKKSAKSSHTECRYFKHAKKSHQSKEVKIKNRSSQTDHVSSKEKKVKNCYSQTDKINLSRKIFINSVVSEVFTRDFCSQTEIPEVVDKDLQCDLWLNLKKNGFTKSVLSNNLIKNVLNNSDSKVFEVADNQTYNRFDYNFFDKNCQTDSQEVTSVGTQYDIFHIFNEFYGKDPYTLSPKSLPYSREVDSKLNIKICFKEEYISPVDCLTIPTSPNKFNPLSPNSADLLQIKADKSDCVKICKLCDKCLYNKKEISIHNKTHMQCHFCKTKFRSLKITQQHINECKLKLCHKLPIVELVRVDDQPWIKKRYSSAFSMF